MTMKIQAMLDWSPEEKAAKAKEWAQSLFTLRLQKATGQLENPMKIKELRKDIARLKTAQHMSAAETAAALMCCAVLRRAMSLRSSLIFIGFSSCPVAFWRRSVKRD